MTVGKIGNLTRLPNEVFRECKALANVTLPDTMETIGTAAFKHCYGLPEIVIPDSVTIIEEEAFSGCTSLQEIIVPDSVVKWAIMCLADAEAQRGLYSRNTSRTCPALV